MHPRKGLCLAMIVKDETHVLLECLESVQKHIAYYVVCDTGSTDDTISKIQSFFAERGIPGEIHSCPWVDFAHNRSECLRYCKATGLPYAWMMDADDLLVGSPTWPHDLTADVYSMQFLCDENWEMMCTFARPVIFRLALDWMFEGVCHERPRLKNAPKQPVKHQCIPGEYHILFRQLGARTRDNPNKFADDARRLETAISCQTVKSPLDVFYLGRSWFDARDFNRALQAYDMFFSLPDTGRASQHLKYWAHLESVQSMIELGSSSDVIIARAGEALAAVPSQAEIHFVMCRYLRNRGLFGAAKLWGKAGVDVCISQASVGDHRDEESMAVRRWEYLYKGGLALELAETELQTEARLSEESCLACARLVVGCDVPKIAREHAKQLLSRLSMALRIRT